MFGFSIFGLFVFNFWSNHIAPDVSDILLSREQSNSSSYQVESPSLHNSSGRNERPSLRPSNVAKEQLKTVTQHQLSQI